VLAPGRCLARLALQAEPMPSLALRLALPFSALVRRRRRVVALLLWLRAVRPQAPWPLQPRPLVQVRESAQRQALPLSARQRVRRPRQPAFSRQIPWMTAVRRWLLVAVQSVVRV